MYQDEFYSKREIGDLILSYERLKKGEPNNFLEEEDFEDLCDHFENKGNTEKSIEVISLGISIFKYSADLRFRKADLFLSLNRDKEADKLLEEAFVLDSTNEDYFILKLEVLVRRGAISIAVSFINTYLKNLPKRNLIELLEEVAKVFFDYDEPRLAVRYNFRLLKIQTNNKRIFRTIKSILHTDGDGIHYEAIEMYKYLIRINPYNDLAWQGLGDVYNILGLKERALNAYLYAQAINEKDEDILYSLTLISVDCKKYNNAIFYLNQLLEQQTKKHGHLYLILATCYEKTKLYKQAIAEYRTTLIHSPKLSDFINYKIGNIYFKLKDYAEAIQVLKKVSGEKYLLKAKKILGQALIYKKQNILAKQILHECLTLKITDKLSWGLYFRNLVCLNEEVGGYMEAIRHYDVTKDVIFMFYAAGFSLCLTIPKEARGIIESYIEGNEKTFKYVVRYFPEFKQYDWAKQFLKK